MKLMGRISILNKFLEPRTRRNELRYNAVTVLIFSEKGRPVSKLDFQIVLQDRDVLKDLHSYPYTIEILES